MTNISGQFDEAVSNVKSPIDELTDADQEVALKYIESKVKHIGNPVDKATVAESIAGAIVEAREGFNKLAPYTELFNLGGGVSEDEVIFMLNTLVQKRRAERIRNTAVDVADAVGNRVRGFGSRLRKR